MKITNYVLVYVLAALVVFLSIHIKSNELTVVTEEVQQYNKNLDSALNSAVQGVVEVSDGELHINKDEAVELFMKSLYASFGISDDDTLQEAFNVYIPAVAIADIDGLYIHFNYYDKNKIRRVWTPMFPYVYKEGDFTINYHLDDTVVATDNTTGRKYEFPYDRMSDEITEVNYPYEWARARKLFDLDCLGSEYYDYKTYAVTDCITQHMSYYVNLNNELAQAFGISYTFSLPESATSEMSRAVNDITFMALFQGYPMGGSESVYSKFAIAGTRVLKKNGYHLGTIDGVLYYHRLSCTKSAFDTIDTFTSKVDCALQGALPCPYCKP